MKVVDILPNLDIGSPVAEFDTRLQDFFVETQIYRDFINDKHDIIAGDKGTGKSAIYKIVRDRYRAVPELEDVELLSGFNDSGNPVFQRLAQSEPLSEGQYITVWKSYILSLLGNYMLDICEGAYTENTEELDRVLKAIGLRSQDSSAITIFSQISNLVKRILNPKSAEITMTITDYGMPLIKPKIDFSEITPEEVAEQYIINNEDAIALLNRLIGELGICVWLVLDRLDEAFSGFPKVEIPALRALLRTYLDMQAYEFIRIKLFVRNDLFRKIISGGFVNLTHINARKVEIHWHSEDLHALLCRRVRESGNFWKLWGINDKVEDHTIFEVLFPPQVDVGAKKPTTWNWILGRIKDGNEIIPPRNLIDIFNFAKQAQSRREERAPRVYSKGTSILEADSIRRGLSVLSEQRVQDTLLSESGEYSSYIEAFKDKKAEHNEKTLAQLLQCEKERFKEVTSELIALGFLAKSKETYKVPLLYRGGLNITQGKAFT